MPCSRINLMTIFEDLVSVIDGGWLDWQRITSRFNQSTVWFPVRPMLYQSDIFCSIVNIPGS